MKRMLSFFAASLMIASAAAAQIPGIDVGFGVRAGARTLNKGESGELLLGGQVQVGISKLTLVPNYEYISAKTDIGVVEYDVTLHTINLDAQYEIYGLAVAKMFVGGGYVIQLSRPDGTGTVNETNNGFNVQIGGKAGVGPLNIFGLAKANFIKVKSVLPNEDSKNRTNFALVIGANFNLL